MIFFVCVWEWVCVWNLATPVPLSKLGQVQALWGSRSSGMRGLGVEGARATEVEGWTELESLKERPGQGRGRYWRDSLWGYGNMSSRARVIWQDWIEAAAFDAGDSRSWLGPWLCGRDQTASTHRMLGAAGPHLGGRGYSASPNRARPWTLFASSFLFASVFSPACESEAINFMAGFNFSLWIPRLTERGESAFFSFLFFRLPFFCLPSFLFLHFFVGERHQCSGPPKGKLGDSLDNTKGREKRTPIQHADQFFLLKLCLKFWGKLRCLQCPT